jgi:hypothetical protein
MGTGGMGRCRDKDEGFAGEAGVADRWGFNTIGPLRQS